MAWVGIGCGGLLLILLVVVALLVGTCQAKFKNIADEMSDPETAAATSAEIAVKLNPELDLVSSDREAGTITFRNKKSGKETTVTYEDIAEGKFTVETEDGTTTIEGKGGGIRTETADGVATFGRGGIEKLPKWFEVPAGVTNWQSIMHQERGGKVSGTIRGETTLDLAAVIGSFSKNLEAAGFERKARTEIGTTIAVSYEKDGASRQTVNVNATPQDQKGFIQMTYSER